MERSPDRLRALSMKRLMRIARLDAEDARRAADAAVLAAWSWLPGVAPPGRARGDGVAARDAWNLSCAQSHSRTLISCPT
jgi:hypothetical protein